MEIKSETRGLNKKMKILFFTNICELSFFLENVYNMLCSGISWNWKIYKIMVNYVIIFWLFIIDYWAFYKF